jgi:hypothetical protein
MNRKVMPKDASFDDDGPLTSVPVGGRKSWSAIVDEAYAEAVAVEERRVAADSRRREQIRRARELFADISPYGLRSKHSFFGDLPL